MYAAGKRKIRPPARFALSPTEQDQWHSTPAENFNVQLTTELLDASRRLEKLKTELGMQAAELETAEALSTTPSPDCMTLLRQVRGQPSQEALHKMATVKGRWLT